MGARKRQFTVGPGQLVIDFGAEQGRDLVPDLIEYLNSGPSLSALPQMLTLDFLGEFGARSFQISLLGADATLRSVAAFGVPEAAEEFLSSVSLWDDLPMTHAIREQATVVVPSAEIHALRFPDSEARHLPSQPTIAARLASLVGTVGVLTVTFGEELTSYPPAARVVESIADVLVLYLAAQTIVEANNANTPVASERQTRPLASREAPERLTPRQQKILELLCQDLTYEQIAMRIKFSHSTVRQELGVIYRYLNVSSRHDAIRVALGRGLTAVALPSEGAYESNSVAS
jgi:DNA-binding CsgD family transcriptional regulator